MRRRRFIASSAGVSAVLVSGCAGLDEDDLGGETDDDQQSDGSASGTGEQGTFRLLISDMPADIGDFDSLDVWFSSARVFRGDGEEEEADEEEETDDEAENEDEADDDEETGDEDDEEETDAEATEDDEEEDPDEDDEAEDEDGEDDDDPGGFVEFELEDANVDLTEVVGERAMPVLEDELDAGTYSGVHLFVEDVEGIVDGEEVGVKVPSEKLKIVKPFEIGSEETVSFVFDINVVKRGNNDEYNLLPVVAKSGVNGEDVEVDEVEGDEEDDTEDSAEDDDDEAEDSAEDGDDEAEDSADSGEDDDEQDQSGDAANESGDAENAET